KLNEKYRQFVAKSAEGKSNPVTSLVDKELGPVMDKINQALKLTPEERDLFLKYCAGYNGKPPVENKFFDYFRANQATTKYAIPEKTSPGAMSQSPPIAAVKIQPTAYDEG